MNSLFFISSKALSLIVVFVCTTLVARELGPSQFGLFSEMKLYISIIFVVSVFGNDAYVISLLSKGVNKHRVTVILLIRLTLFFSLSSVVLLFIDSEFFLPVFLIYFLQIVNFSFLILSSQSNGKLYFLYSSSALFLTIFFGFLLYLSGFYYYLYYISLFYFFIFLVSIRVFVNGFIRPNFNLIYSDVKHLFFDVWPLILSALLVLLYTRVDFFLVTKFLTPAELGIYSVAIQLSEPFSFIASAYAMSVIPKLSKLTESLPEKITFLSKKLRMMHLLVIIIIIAYMIFGKKLIVSFYGDSYLAAFDLLIILMLSKFFVFSNLFFSVVMVVESNYLARLFRIFISLCIATILSVFLIPIYGLTGAAFGVVISQFISITFVNAISIKTRDYCIIFFRSFLIWK